MSRFTLLIDAGTTNARVTLLDAAFTVLDTVKKDAGVHHTAMDGHNGRLKTALKDAIDTLMANHGLQATDITRCIAYGMITSNVGLVEIPHCIAPVDTARLHEAMSRHLFLEIAPFPIDFIPGVRNFQGPVDLENFSGMDMMRGEETEALGLWHLVHPMKSCIFLLPGSHNKFVRMDENGSIISCQTSLSGELLDVLTHQTILADSVHHAFVSEETYDRTLLLAGFHEAERSGLGRAAFAGRILSTLGHLSPEKAANYLLGAVLQTDVMALCAFCAENVPLFIAGKQPLKRALTDIFHTAGFPGACEVPEDACQRMGIVGAMQIAGNV